MRLHISDSWLDSSLHLNQNRQDWNAILELRIRTYLEPYQPDSGTETLDGIRVIAWNSEPAPVPPRLSWTDYKQTFKQEIESFWSNHLWLVPSYQWAVMGRGSTPPPSRTIPNISCRLSIQWASRAMRTYTLRWCVFILKKTFADRAAGCLPGGLASRIYSPPSIRISMTLMYLSETGVARRYPSCMRWGTIWDCIMLPEKATNPQRMAKVIRVGTLWVPVSGLSHGMPFPGRNGSKCI